MSWDASRYVRKLRGVTRTEKAVLFVLAEYHNQKAQAAWPALPTLAADVDISERQLIRILQNLESPREDHPEGILKRSRKSDGRGYVTEYSFLEIFGKGDITVEKGDISECERVTFSTQKGDISQAPIRKEPYLEPKNKTLPNPPLQGGNLSIRDRRKLNQLIHEYQNLHLGSQGWPRYDQSGAKMVAIAFDECVRLACMELLIPLDDAYAVIKAAGFGDKKEPQAVTA